MKKLALFIMALGMSFSLFACGGTQQGESASNTSLESSVQNPTSSTEPLKQGVSYVSLENAPTMDGVIDEIWDCTYSMQTSYNWLESPLLKGSTIKVMWNETGLYFLAKVIDGDPVDLDRVNFWVSEVYTTEEGDYSTNPDDGNYAICITPTTQNMYYAGIDASAYWTAGAKYTETGYIVEVFMPVVGTIPLEAGSYIGFDVSIDHYITGNDERQHYDTLFNLGSYWNNVGVLNKLELFDRI